MEHQVKITQLEELAVVMMQVINDQSGYMAGIVQMIDWMRQYIRAIRMMARVCQATAPIDSEAELDLTAMSQFLADVEIWLDYQDKGIRERLDWLTLFNESLQQFSESSNGSMSQSDEHGDARLKS